MSQAVLHRRVRRTGSLLILLGVMLLVVTGVVHLGPPVTAQADPSGIITVAKHASWDPSLDFQFTLQSVDITPPVTETFTLRDSPPGWAGQSFYSLPLGTYEISEVIPTGWHATAIFCRDRVSPSPIVATGDLSTGSVTVTLTDSLPGIDCEFSNDFIHGRLRVQKITNFPYPLEIPTLFDFDPSWSDTNFTLTSGNAVTFSLAPGQYSVTELAEAGWDLTLARCGEGDNNPDLDADPNSVTVELAADQFIDCRFINQSTEEGRIIVDKVTTEPSDHAFEFDPSWSSGNFTLTDAQDPHDSGDLAVGTYSVAESPEPGWDVTGISCTYIPPTGGAPVGIGTEDLENGEVTGLELVDDRVITCTFTNQLQTGEIYVHKTGGPDTGGFDFQVTGGASPILLSDVPAGGSASTGAIPSGTYSVVEIDDPDDGWSEQQDPATYCNSNLGDVVDGFAPSEFVLQPGEVIDCYFTNERLTGSIVLAKRIEDPADLYNGEAFTFDVSWSDQNISLAAGVSTGQIALPTTVGQAPTYAVNEINLPANWIDRGMTCNSSLGGTEDPAAIALSADEVVTCTSLNERAPTGRLTIVKDATPGDNTPFYFSGTGPGINGVVGVRAPNGSVPLVFPDPLRDPLAPSYTLPNGAGAYVVTEGTLGNSWELDGITCEGNIAVPEVVDLANRTVSVAVGRDEAVICTFSNSGYGFISVKKEVAAGSPDALFAFDPSWGDSFTLTGGEQTMAIKVPAGVHSVAEVGMPPGWSPASAACDDGSDPAAIGVSPGETVTCTFVNRFEEEGGSLTIIKRTTPAGGAGFTFDGTLGAFTLNDGGMKVFEDLDAGSYTVTETPAAGWELEDVTCFGPAGAAVDFTEDGASVTVNLAGGQDVTCKFANRGEEQTGDEGSLTIIKQTEDPGGTGYGFTTSANLSGEFGLDDGGSKLFADLAAGSYTVTESEADASGFVSVNCEAGDWSSDGASVTVNLAEGEAAVCTFLNSGETAGPGDLPYTGSNPFTLPLLFTGLWGLLMGLALWVWSLMRHTDRA